MTLTGSVSPSDLLLSPLANFFVRLVEWFGSEDVLGGGGGGLFGVEIPPCLVVVDGLTGSILMSFSEVPLVAPAVPLPPNDNVSLSPP